MWPLQVYEVCLTRVETIQRHVNKFLRKWLGIPPAFTTVGLYSKSSKLQLPISSIEEEFKVAKVRVSDDAKTPKMRLYKRPNMN